MFLRFVYYLLLHTPSDYPVVDSRQGQFDPYQLF